jgi:hypothetical protein
MLAPSAAPAAPVPVAVTAPAPSGATPRPPTHCKLEILSDPSGATVFREPGEQRIGRTPIAYETATADGLFRFVVRSPGFQDAKVELPADRDGRATVTLTARPATLRARAGTSRRCSTTSDR